MACQDTVYKKDNKKMKKFLVAYAIILLSS
jgi:hypothetical protein